MARRRGCRGCGCFIAIILIVALLAGGVYAAYNFTAPSTFGLTNIGGLELGDLADKNFVEIVDTFNKLSTLPNKTSVVKTTYNEETVLKDWGIEEEGKISVSTGQFGKINRYAASEKNKIETATDVLTKQIVTTTPQEITIKGIDFVYLLNEILDDIEKLVEGDYKELRAVMTVFRTSVDHIPIVVEEVSLQNTANNPMIHTVFQLDTSKCKSAFDNALSLIPSFIRPSIGDKIYVTTDSKVTVDATTGKLAVAATGGTIKINSMTEKESASVYNAVFTSMTNVSLQTLSSAVSGTVVQIANNLGGVGRLNNGAPSYGAAGGSISTVPATGGTVRIITKSNGTGGSSGNQGGTGDEDPDTPPVNPPEGGDENPDNPPAGGDENPPEGGDDNQGGNQGGNEGGDSGDENPDDNQGGGDENPPAGGDE